MIIFNWRVLLGGDSPFFYGWHGFYNDHKNFGAMYKMQIFLDVLKAVSEETELDSDLILSPCKQEEVVDARSLLIEVMSEKGLYPTQISKLTGISTRRVTAFLLRFNERVNSRKILRINYENVRKKVGIT